jgi:hypothetical protein
MMSVRVYRNKSPTVEDMYELRRNSLMNTLTNIKELCEDEDGNVKRSFQKIWNAANSAIDFELISRAADRAGRRRTS